MPMMKYTLLGLALSHLSFATALAAESSRPLFSAKEKQLVRQLTSVKHSQAVLHEMISADAKIRNRELSQNILRDIAKSERIKRDQFLTNTPWEHWEKQENFNAMNRWLERISPQNHSSPSTKDKP